MGWQDAPVVEAKPIQSEWSTAPEAGSNQQQQQAKALTPTSYTNPSSSNRIDAFIRAVNQGVFLNLGDELNAAKNATIAPLLGNKSSQAPSWYQRYQENLSRDRDLDKANQKKYPITSAAGNIVGAIPLGGMLKAATTVPEAMAQGTLLGGAYGFGEGEGDLKNRIAGAAEGELAGGLTAGAVSKASTVIPQIAAMFGPKAAPVPTSAELKAAASQAYKAVDNSGMQIAPNSIGKLNAGIMSTLEQMGHHPQLQPKAAVVLNELGNLEQTALKKGGASLQDLDIMRRIAGHAASSIEPSDKMMGRVIQDKIDDFVGNIGPQDVMGNIDQTALDALSNARDLWARASKGQMIDKLIEKAGLNSQSMQSVPGGQALRTQFRKLANNDRGMSRFTPDEQAAIRKVAEGSQTERIARLVGKFSPDQVIPALSEMGAVGAALATGNPGAAFGTGALASLGLAGKLTSNAMTGKNARMASELMRRGAPAQTSASSPVASAIQDAITRGAPLSSLIPLSLMGQSQ